MIDDFQRNFKMDLKYLPFCVVLCKIEAIPGFMLNVDISGIQNSIS